MSDDRRREGDGLGGGDGGGGARARTGPASALGPGRIREADRLFVARRARLVRTWPAVGSVALLGLGALVVWLFATNPLLVNPVRVAEGVRSGEISDGTLALLAGMLPIAVLASIVVVLAILLLSFRIAANERRHVAIIEALSRPEEASGSGPAGREREGGSRSAP